MVEIFLKKMRTQFKCFKKIETKILDVDNFGIYNPAKSHFKIWCILGYEKRTNLIKFQTLKICTVHNAQIYIFIFFGEPEIQKNWT
jgi:hypothetical protein